MSKNSFKEDMANMERLALFVSIVGILSALGVILCAVLGLV